MNLTRLKRCLGVLSMLSCDQNTLLFIKILFTSLLLHTCTNGTEMDDSCCFNTLANSFSIVKR